MRTGNVIEALPETGERPRATQSMTTPRNTYCNDSPDGVEPRNEKSEQVASLLMAIFLFRTMLMSGMASVHKDMH